MSDNSEFEEMVSRLERDLNQRILEERAAMAFTAARLTGAVYTVAVTSGVPHDLAQEMATDYWTKEMQPTTDVITEGEVDVDE
ncbi:hypothetical protein ACH427_03325 [Streptomyces sp. NPDC020379]|uniref:hypothetical protein n=1 Tax=Streptomyces sp. NPDC020379 TaxID=3365071 RepID=UPI0037A455FC